MGETKVRVVRLVNGEKPPAESLYAVGMEVIYAEKHPAVIVRRATERDLGRPLVANEQIRWWIRLTESGPDYVEGFCREDELQLPRRG